MKYFIFPKIKEESIGRFTFGSQPLTLLILHNIFEKAGFFDIVFYDENIADQLFDSSELDDRDYVFISINLFNQNRAIALIGDVIKTNAKIVIGGPIIELVKEDITKIGLKQSEKISSIYGGWKNITDLLFAKFNITTINHSWDGLHNFQSHRIDIRLVEKYTLKHKDYSGFKYHGNYTNIHSKLGCSYRIHKGGCNFCSRHFEEYEELRPSSLVNLLKDIWLNYNVNFFWDSSDSFFNANQDLEAYCKAGIEEMPIELMIFSRLNNINANTASKLKKCKVKTMIVGVESGSDRILNIANKHLTLNQIYRAFDLLNKYDISIIPCFTIGHPTENINDLEKTIQLARNIAKNYKIDGFSCSPIMPMPNSNYFINNFRNIEILNLQNLTELQELYFLKNVGFSLNFAKTVCSEIESIQELKPLGIWSN